MFVFTSCGKNFEKEKLFLVQEGKANTIKIFKGYYKNLTNLQKSLFKLKKVVSIGSRRAFSMNDLSAKWESGIIGLVE